MVRILNGIWNPDNWSHFVKNQPDHLKSELQKVWISNSQILYPHCNWMFGYRIITVQKNVFKFEFLFNILDVPSVSIFDSLFGSLANLQQRKQHLEKSIWLYSYIAFQSCGITRQQPNIALQQRKWQQCHEAGLSWRRPIAGLVLLQIHIIVIIQSRSDKGSFINAPTC